MAMRKSTMKEQVSASIAQQNPGDQALETFVSITGPSPWLMAALGFVGRMMVKYYFVTVTQQAIVVHRMHMFNNRPQEITHVIPRDQAQGAFSDVKLNPLWSSVRMALPGEAAPVRLNVPRLWRTELEQVLAMAGGAPQQFPGQPGMAPGQPMGAPQQAVPQQGYAPQQPPQGAPQPGYQQQAPQPGYQPAAPQQQPGYPPAQPQQPQGAPQPQPGYQQQPGYPPAQPQQPGQYGYPPAPGQPQQPGYPQPGQPQQGNPYGG
ncbi:hypothetical protein [Streptomyces chattanoogensis]|uniref:hypothetical protein n=1 Tax=Streptomyces chattanoogensis TaxID=66876 RepID=UPI0036763193